MISLRHILTSSIILLSLLTSQALMAKNYEKFDLESAPAGLYELDKTHGYVTFSYLHQGYSRPWLRFRDVDATLDLVASNVEKSQLEVSIKAASIDSGVDVFDEHLRGKKFFKVDQYPEVTFSSTSIAIDGENVTVTGDLTIMETTQAVSLSGVFNRGGLHFKSKKPMMGFSASTTLIRSEWGLGYATPFVGDEVEVLLEVEFIRKHPLASKPK